ncbi:VOC family protein [uncultured Hoeflea sp.]|uniref:VOC family protein n=1 Tax=uncultured Hoeflea sp. TaxID=538666 RepID=UPI00260F92ED|nr:VOC family protein [uncultured Hoeflea sp.]
MKAQFSHLALIVSDLAVSRAFYLEALAPLGFVEADGKAGSFVRLSNSVDMVVVLVQVETRFCETGYHRKNVGMHHFALSVGSKEDVDAMAQHVQEIGLSLQGAGKVETSYRGGYSSFMFEDPDRISIEIVHHQASYFNP